MIASEQQLEDLLSEPSPADARAMAEMNGDLIILGVGGKMGPSLARRARRACELAKVAKRITGVARFSEPGVRESLEGAGIETVSVDLLVPHALASLPDAPNVLYMAARKFGSTGAEQLTWAMNALLPALVAERYPAARIVAFSTGNVYPLVSVAAGRRDRRHAPGPRRRVCTISACPRTHFRILLAPESDAYDDAAAELRDRSALRRSARHRPESF